MQCRGTIYKFISRKMENFFKINRKILKIWNIFPLMKIDEIDIKILRALKEHANMTISQISHKLVLPLTTVHNRIKKLNQEKIIKNYTINLDYRKLGKEISAFIFLTVDYTRLEQDKDSQLNLATELKKYPCVEEVAMITGQQDILLKVRFENVSALNSFVTGDLRNVEGIEKTQTLLILQEVH